jgi:molybdopterin/thiamine biosynthesis adenylyltransferase
MRPRIIVPQDLLAKMQTGTDGIKKGYGIARHDEGLVQILSLQPQDDFKGVAEVRADGLWLEGFQFTVPFPEIEAIPVSDEFVARSQGVIDTSVIASKKVAFVGVGSVGSALALHLAQSAMGNFTLLDPDTFSAANLSRHAGDLRDLGRYKTKAVRDLILRRNARATVQTFEEDFLALSWGEQVARLEGADLVIAATDSTPAQFMLNELCHSMNIASLYVGCYERACAGEVLFVIPGKTPCFNCFMEFRQTSLPELKKNEQRIPYSDEATVELQGEPGLTIDIAYVVAIASSYSLALLLPDSGRRSLLDIERNLTLVHSGTVPQGQYSEIFHMPFDLLLAHVKRDASCPVCQKSLDD